MGSGRLFIVSAPSGTGKTTLVEQLVQVAPDLVMSRSYTSRPARPDEIDGVDYNFIDSDRFELMIDKSEFLEWADIFGYRYGTSAIDTQRLLDSGQDVVLIIDVKGAKDIRRRGIEAVMVFVFPPSFQVLEDRLRCRSGSSSTEEQLRDRLETARREVDQHGGYQYAVVNDNMEKCVEELRSIVVAERLRTTFTNNALNSIVETFRSGQTTKR